LEEVQQNNEDVSVLRNSAALLQQMLLILDGLPTAQKGNQSTEDLEKRLEFKAIVESMKKSIVAK
jgi:hypothetical protein